MKRGWRQILRRCIDCADTEIGSRSGLLLSIMLRVVLCFGLVASGVALRPTATQRLQVPRQKLLRTPLRVRGGDVSSLSTLAVAETVCPALGVVLSNALYASPIPALRECVKKGELGSLNPLPSAIMVIGTTAWCMYAMAVKNPWILASNVPGALVAYYQMVTMLPLMKKGPQLTQFQNVILGGAAVTLVLWSYLIFTGAAVAQAAGIFATIICVILFASPLSTIATVIKTGNSASILAPLTLSQVANCALWTAYGVFAAHDVFVWGPNGTGLVLGLAQLALKVLFPSKKEE